MGPSRTTSRATRPGRSRTCVGVYHYWDFLNTHSRGGFNDCRDVGGDGSVRRLETFIPLPTGIDEATVYTDEHGEAIIWFIPDVGAS